MHTGQAVAVRRVYFARQVSCTFPTCFTTPRISAGRLFRHRSMVGRAGLEPAAFLMSQVYSLLPSPFGYRPIYKFCQLVPTLLEPGGVFVLPVFSRECARPFLAGFLWLHVPLARNGPQRKCGNGKDHITHVPAPPFFCLPFSAGGPPGS